MAAVVVHNIEGLLLATADEGKDMKRSKATEKIGGLWLPMRHTKKFLPNFGRRSGGPGRDYLSTVP